MLTLTTHIHVYLHHPQKNGDIGPGDVFAGLIDGTFAVDVAPSRINPLKRPSSRQ